MSKKDNTALHHRYNQTAFGFAKSAWPKFLRERLLLHANFLEEDERIYSEGLVELIPGGKHLKSRVRRAPKKQDALNEEMESISFRFDRREYPGKPNEWHNFVTAPVFTDFSFMVVCDEHDPKKGVHSWIVGNMLMLPLVIPEYTLLYGDPVLNAIEDVPRMTTLPDARFVRLRIRRLLRAHAALIAKRREHAQSVLFYGGSHKWMLDLAVEEFPHTVNE